MIVHWLVLAAGFVATAFGATAGAALLAVSRAVIARAVALRLRRGEMSLAGLAAVEERLSAASSLTSFGVILLAAAVPAVVASGGVAGSAAVLAIGAVPLVLGAGYFVPRWLTELRAEAVMARIGPVLDVVSRGLRLLLPARPPNAPPDFRAVWREGAALAPRADADLRIADGVISFAERPVRTVMTPRTDVVAVPAEMPPTEIALVFAQSGYSRLPVYRGTLDEIVGMVHVFDLFKWQAGDPLPIRPVAMTPASRRAGDLLLDMQRERRHLAVVLDEFGGTLGLCTLEDLLEQLVGEIHDEHDEPAPAPAETGAAVLEADASTARGEVEERFGVRLPEGRAETLAGLVAELAGRIPQPGERFAVAGLEIDVLHASGTRVERLLVRAAAAAIPLGGEVRA
ncbi:MAG: hemolysin family protein [Gemmatimonadales bacterium]|nr:hemolysin family protein [Gemmatimonadales bacterium]